jgi:hypothetical protein
VFVVVSITDTLPLAEFVTYARAPSGTTATPKGASPTGTVTTTVFVAVSITDTVWLLRFTTYAYVCAFAVVAKPATALRIARTIGTKGHFAFPRSTCPSGIKASAKPRQSTAAMATPPDAPWRQRAVRRVSEDMLFSVSWL